MRVIYIASTSHSGSSLLSLCLNSHPEMISVGDLIDLGRRLQVRDNGRFHLIRDPRGQICSMIRKNGGFTEHVFRYAHTHARIRRTLKTTAHSVVRYEDLVLDPEDTLNRILKPLGLKFDPQQLLWSEQVQHTIAGNKLRWQPDGLVLDERWKRNLSWIQRFAIQLGTAYSGRRFAKPHRE